MEGRDPYDYSRKVQRGKSMGEFGEVDTTRTTGRQGWKVKIETNPRKKKRNQRSQNNVSNLLGKWLNRLIN
jgi:hypothetical protein